MRFQSVFNAFIGLAVAATLTLSIFNFYLSMDIRHGQKGHVAEYQQFVNQTYAGHTHKELVK